MTGGGAAAHLGALRLPHSPMDPAIVVFGFGIGVLVGMTGMGGASLMTPLLILIFGIQPVTAIGTDIFYAAVTKTVSGVQHLRQKTVHRGSPSGWPQLLPSAILGVFVIEELQNSIGEDELDGSSSDPRRDSARRRHLDPDSHVRAPGRDQGAGGDAPLPPPHHRRGRHRRHHRLRHRPHLRRLQNPDRRRPDRRLPADAAARRRPRHLPRRRLLSAAASPLGRRQR